MFLSVIGFYGNGPEYYQVFAFFSFLNIDIEKLNVGSESIYFPTNSQNVRA